MVHSIFQYVVSVVALILLLAPQVQAHDHMRPPDVYRLITAISQEIEQLRWIMGAPTNRQRLPDVENASPYEVYFQVLTLHEKSDRLAYQQTHKNGPPASTPIGDISPADVYRTLQAARGRIQALGYNYSSFVAAKLPPIENHRTPSDVFKAVVQTNRQLNLMLEQRFAPSDVYRQVTRAGEYAIAILATYPNPSPPPKTPAVALGKRPADVFQHLLETYELVHRLGIKMGHPMLTLNSWTDNVDAVQPSDVYDIASIIVSELAYVHKRRPGALEPQPVQRFYGKIPSDVCQRVEVLNRLLNELVARNQQ